MQHKTDLNHFLETPKSRRTRYILYTVIFDPRIDPLVTKVNCKQQSIHSKATSSTSGAQLDKRQGMPIEMAQKDSQDESPLLKVGTSCQF